jgi:hypothetical protein
MSLCLGDFVAIFSGLAGLSIAYIRCSQIQSKSYVNILLFSFTLL